MNWKKKWERSKNKRFSNALIISRIIIYPILICGYYNINFVINYTQQKRSIQKLVNSLPKETDFEGLNTHNLIKKYNSKVLPFRPVFKEGYYTQNKRLDNEHVRNMFEMMSMKGKIREINTKESLDPLKSSQKN